jgi:hypothetical protein
MDRDDFIITVSCLLCEHYHALQDASSLRRGGFDPALTDEEVIAIEICGAYGKLSTDKDMWAYLRTPYRHGFPTLGDRTLFGRQAAHVWQLTAAIQQRLTHVSGQAYAPLQPMDTLPLPVCVSPRSRRDPCFKPQPDYGSCAAKDPHSYGFTLGWRLSPLGMITPYPLLAARPPDITPLEALVEDFRGVAPADQGYSDAHKQALLAERHAIIVVTPPRARMQTDHPRALRKACGRWRKFIETVGAHVTERFAVERRRAHDVWHDQHRLIRKGLAHTVAVFLNLQLGRQPLDLDGLVTA